MPDLSFSVGAHISIWLLLHDAEMLAVFSKFLTFRGYTVHSFENSEQACALLKDKQHPDALICDDRLQHPKSIHPFIENIRSVVSSNDMPILVATDAPMSDTSYFRQLLRLGANDVICAPFTGPELVECVNALFDPSSHIEF